VTHDRLSYEIIEGRMTKGKRSCWWTVCWEVRPWCRLQRENTQAAIGRKISPVGDWRSTSLEWRFSILDPWI